MLALTLLVLSPASCGGGEASPPTSLPSSPPAADSGAFPRPVADTRAAILAAAEAEDYGQLRAVLEQDVFLSDWGFGDDAPDPIGQWEGRGLGPLKTMSALLRMPHVVRDTNEGTLYQWPRFSPDSSTEDLTGEERDLLLEFMSEGELEDAFPPEYGYTAPRLGILADGTWWFLVLEKGP